MNKIRQLITAVLLLISTSAAVSQTQTTPNLITNNPAHWSGIGGYSQLGGQHPITLWGPTTSYSGSQPFMDTSTGSPNGQSGQFIWSYGNATVSQVIAINQALAGVGAGVQISGYNWGYEVRNMNGNNGQSSYSDVLTATTFMTNSLNQRILSDTRTYSGASEWNWYGGTKSLATPLDMVNAGNLGIEFSSRDAGFWAGYYGPQVRNVDLSLNYTAAPVDPCVANPQSSPACPGFRTYYNMTDDGYARVDLPFAFPFYGQVFTTSYMYTNGVVGFLNNNWGFCCDGTDLNGQIGNANSPWNYAIYALNTDLYPGANSRFYTQQTDAGTGLKYTWENVVEIGTNNANTFSVNIKDSGYIGINYQQVSLNAWRNPLIGIAGNISQGQYSQHYFGPASSLPGLAGQTLTFTGTETTDVCAQNPLYNPVCPGYAAAYLAQQCSISSLYDPQCPGYAAAYLTYQCNISQLYSPSCPGYQQAYFDQQCSLDPLYNSSCPGYQQAYFNQQCSLDGLYDTACPNYADAYYVQQCTANPLYDSGCTGYAQAYFDQQCAADGLYSNQCPNYAEAYALKYVVNTPSTPATDTTQIAVTTTTDPVASAAPVVADPIVNQAVTATATSARPAQAATATVPLVAAPQPVATAATSTEQTKEETKTETASTESSSSTASTASASTDKKEQPKTARQALAERRLAAARAQAVEAGKDLANKMGEAATMESQAAVQNVVIQAMGFTPGFDAYSKAVLPDVAGYRPFEIYRGQRNIDNPAGRRFMTGSDQLHSDMVDQQYGRLAR